MGGRKMYGYLERLLIKIGSIGSSSSSIGNYLVFCIISNTSEHYLY